MTTDEKLDALLSMMQGVNENLNFLSGAISAGMDKYTISGELVAITSCIDKTMEIITKRD